MEGADLQTGQGYSITVDADTKSQAEQIARARGLAVSAVHPAGSLTAAEHLNAMVGVAEETGSAEDPPAVDYATPTAPLTPTPAFFPEYEGIIKGAKLLRRSAVTMQVLGWFCAIFAALALCGGMLGLILFYSVPQELGATIPLTLFFAAAAIVLFNRATMFRLQAELALATRDIARNSFR
ncbi:MAG TPA: hypothetical protein VH518_15190 [Tepidisphaeraceae bacterium]